MRLACSRTRANSSFLRAFRFFWNLAVLALENHDLLDPSKARCFGKTLAFRQTVGASRSNASEGRLQRFAVQPPTHARAWKTLVQLALRRFCGILTSRENPVCIHKTGFEILRVKLGGQRQRSPYNIGRYWPMCDICFSSERCSNLKLKLSATYHHFSCE